MSADFPFYVQQKAHHCASRADKPQTENAKARAVERAELIAISAYIRCLIETAAAESADKSLGSCRYLIHIHLGFDLKVSKKIPI